MTTITIKEDIQLPKTVFQTLEDAYHASLDLKDEPYFKALDSSEITEKRKKDWDEVEGMNDADFVRIEK